MSETENVLTPRQWELLVTHLPSQLLRSDTPLAFEDDIRKLYDDRSALRALLHEALGGWRITIDRLTNACIGDTDTEPDEMHTLTDLVRIAEIGAAVFKDSPANRQPETDYDRFQRDHPQMLKLAEEHLEKTGRMAGKINRLMESVAALLDAWDRQADETGEVARLRQAAKKGAT